MSTPHEHINALAQVGAVLDTSDMQAVARLCECSKAFLRQRALNVLQKHKSDPVLLSYSSDGTPLKTQETFTQSVGSLSVKRRGGSSHEYLIQRFFILPWKGEPTIFFRDPHAMSDKTAWCLLGAAMDFFPTARQAGHTGLCVSHYCWDRAVYGAMARHFRELHALVAKQMANNRPQAEARMLELLDWTFSSGCCNHDAHNGFKWGVAPHIASPDMLKDLWVICESLRGGYELLMQHLGQWLSTRIAFDSWDDMDDIQEFWVMLGLEPQWVQVLVSLQLRFHDGCLRVAPAWQDDPKLCEVVSTCLLHVFRFKSFTESRWVSMGPVCRTLCASLALGLESLVEHVLGQPKTSEYFLGGFRRMRPDIRKFIAVAAVSSYPSDSFLAQLLEDDRVAKNSCALEESLGEELQYVAHLGTPVLQFLAGLAGLPLSVMRSGIMTASLVSAGFITFKVLKPVHELPWSLLVGDKSANLEALKSGQPPAEKTSLKIYNLLHMGFSRNQILAGLCLAEEASWSTAVTEQGHGSASSIMKGHKQYGSASMTAKAMLHMVKPLLQQSLEHKKIETLQARLRTLEKRSPSKVSGRHIYVRQLFQVAASWKSDGKWLPADHKLQIMGSHAKRWAALPDESKGQFTALAQVHQETVRLDTEQTIAHTRAKLRLHSERVEIEKAEGGKPLRVSSCRLSASEVAALDAFCVSPEFTARRVAAMRESALTPAEPPPPALQSTLSTMLEDTPGASSTGRAPWLSAVCKSRDHFARAVFKLCTAQGERHVLFVYAVQSPRMVCFNDIVPMDTYTGHEPVTGSSWESICTQQWVHVFQIQWMSFCFDESIELLADSAVEVLLDMHFLGPDQLASDAEWQTLESVLKEIQPQDDPPGTHASATASSSSSHVGVDVARYPWLADFQQQMKQQSTKHADGSEKKGWWTEHEAAKDVEEEEEEAHPLHPDTAGVFAELEAKRIEWGSSPVSDHDFPVSILGGTWSATQRGVSYHAFRAMAKAGQATEFCRKYAMNITCNFEVALYGDEVASLMCRAWSHRMQFFLNLWKASEDPGLVYDEGSLSGYEEPSDFALVATTATGKLATRVAQIRRLRPGNPVR